jgi:hypothetical protein
MTTRLGRALVFACALIVSFRLPAPAAQHPALATIAAFVSTANAGDRRAFLRLFAPEAAMVDNFAPYRFAAPNGPATWYDGFGADMQQSGESDGVISVTAPTYFRVHGDRAWAVVPTGFVYKRKSKRERETGLSVFTLHRVAGAWKITSFSWAEQSDTGAP